MMEDKRVVKEGNDPKVFAIDTLFLSLLSWLFAFCFILAFEIVENIEVRTVFLIGTALALTIISLISVFVNNVVKQKKYVISNGKMVIISNMINPTPIRSVDIDQIEYCYFIRGNPMFLFFSKKRWVYSGIFSSHNHERLCVIKMKDELNRSTGHGFFQFTIPYHVYREIIKMGYRIRRKKKN